jgi:hydroxyacylglutathione hydrolase
MIALILLKKQEMESIMELLVLSNGIFGSNTYLLCDQNECAVIDCGVDSKDVLRKVNEKNLTIKYIILTHGHVDHVYYADSLKQASKALLCLHEDEYELYSDSFKNGFALFGVKRDVKLPAPDRLLKDGDKLKLGNTQIEVIHTPGHSPGSICLLCEGVLLSGDTLFALSVGRTDLYGGSFKQLVSSLNNRLFSLDGDIVVYPGHGPETTIEYERENNPYA